MTIKKSMGVGGNGRLIRNYGLNTKNVIIRSPLIADVCCGLAILADIMAHINQWAKYHQLQWISFAMTIVSEYLRTKYLYLHILL